MYCPKCGTENLDTVSFCRRCGANIGIVSQALTGNLPAVADVSGGEVGRRRRRNRPPSLERGISKIFSGIAFLVIAFCVMLYAPAGHIWWFWLLIPAFASIGKGVAEFLRWRHEQNRQLPASNASVATSTLPPRNTGELPPRVTPIESQIPIQQPPSVTEATTRHLDSKTPVESLFEKEK